MATMGIRTYRTVKKLLNPRGYLSWTQIDMWERNPERYIRQYIHGDAGMTNDAMEFGKKTSDALENGAATGDLLLDTVVAMLPAYERREHEIKATMSTPHGDVVLLGKLDTFGMKKGPRFREYKTGRTKWTLAKAQKHGQMRHYGTLVYLFHGKLPTEAHLDWAETDWIDGELSFTGNLQSFPVAISMQDVLEYMARATRVAVAIDKAYRKELDKMS